MKICVATAPVKNCKYLPKCDLCLFPFGAIGEVDYESELDGKEEKCGQVAALSKTFNCGVMCACITDSRSLVRKSVVAASGGKLLGISDMLSVFGGESFKSGATLGCYNINGYRVGVCIENDIYFPDIIKSLSLFGCNVIVAFCENLSDNIPPIILRAFAYIYGVPIVLCANKIAYFADITGEIASSNQNLTLFESDPKNYYRVVSTRRRGIFCDFTGDY
jgi:predicted amidohydrolase